MKRRVRNTLHAPCVFDVDESNSIDWTTYFGSLTLPIHPEVVVAVASSDGTSPRLARTSSTQRKMRLR